VARICEEHDGQTVLIATHASPVRAIQGAASGSSTSDIAFVANASINLFTYDGGKLSVKELNIVEHLGDLRTDLPGDFEKK
jgi:broad specificity phosphatase PhoE